jgi:hypothetical protein
MRLRRRAGPGGAARAAQKQGRDQQQTENSFVFHGDPSFPVLLLPYRRREKPFSSEKREKNRKQLQNAFAYGKMKAETERKAGDPLKRKS